MLVDVLLVIAVGLASGYASGLFGIGGGLLRIPIFLYLLPVLGVAAAQVMHAAAGTSLAVAVPTTLVAWRSQHKAGNVDRAVLRTWLPALGVGVVIGIFAARYVSGRVLESVFAIVVLLLAVRMLTSQSRATEDDPAAAEDPTACLPSRLVLSMLALVIGVVSPMVGVVGGTFATPLLTELRYPVHRAVAASSVGGLVVSVLGTIGFVIAGWDAMGLPGRFIGFVDPMVLALMTPCVLVTVPLGVRTSNRLSPQTLQRLFGLLLLVVALDVARKVIFWYAS